MRITVEIEESKIEAIQKWTNERKKSPAVAQALDEFLEHRQRQQLLTKVMAGETDYRASNDELESLSDLTKP
jgi:menaquinone-dependent protoporphyrinogen IX oxidase